MTMMRRDHILRQVRALWHATRGNAGVEFALILPFLMLLLFGGYEIGRALHDYHVVAETVRDATRYLGRASYTCAAGSVVACSPCNKATGECGHCDFDDPADLAAAEALAMTGKTNGGSNLLGTWTDPTSVSVEMCTIDNSAATFSGLYQDAEVVPHVRLTAQVPFTFLFGELISPDGQIDITLSHNVIAAGL